MRGHVAITDLADYGLELPVDSDAYNSVGGFVFGELGRLPKRGDMVTHNGYSIRVESVRENRIEAVRIRERAAPGRVEPIGASRRIATAVTNCTCGTNALPCAPTDCAASAVEEERGRSWGGSTERH